jgi:hypothetical protein
MKRIPLSSKEHSEESVGSPGRFVCALRLRSLLEAFGCWHTVVTLKTSDK